MATVIRLIGGPADGKTFAVSEKTEVLVVPYPDPAYSFAANADNLFADVIGWDDYGLIFDSHTLQARYNINGDIGTYEEKQADG
jgi:hypothetical protein